MLLRCSAWLLLPFVAAAVLLLFLDVPASWSAILVRQSRRRRYALNTTRAPRRQDVVVSRLIYTKKRLRQEPAAIELHRRRTRKRSSRENRRSTRGGPEGNTRSADSDLLSFELLARRAPWSGARWARRVVYALCAATKTPLPSKWLLRALSVRRLGRARARFSAAAPVSGRPRRVPLPLPSSPAPSRSPPSMHQRSGPTRSAILSPPPPLWPSKTRVTASSADA